MFTDNGYRRTDSSGWWPFKSLNSPLKAKGKYGFGTMNFELGQTSLLKQYYLYKNRRILGTSVLVHECVCYLDKVVNAFQVRQVVVCHIHANTEVQAGIAPVDDLEVSEL